VSVDATAHVRWIGTLPTRGRSSIGANHWLITEALRARPGDWHVLPCLGPNYSTAIRSGSIHAYRPAGTYEATSIGGVLYARYVGNPEVAT
jgi:hypothetical protein